jgi:hypothetical protein
MKSWNPALVVTAALMLVLSLTVVSTAAPPDNTTCSQLCKSLDGVSELTYGQCMRGCQVYYNPGLGPKLVLSVGGEEGEPEYFDVVSFCSIYAPAVLNMSFSECMRLIHDRDNY